MKRTLLFLMALIMSAGFTFAQTVIMDFSGVGEASSNAGQKGWEVEGILDKIAAAKYLVLETEGVGDNADGFSKIFVTIQGGSKDGTVNIGWTTVGRTDSLSFPRADGKIVSIALDLKNVLGDKYDDFLKCDSWAQLIVSYWDTNNFPDLGLQQVYLTTDFAKPAGAVDLTGGTDWGFAFNGSVTNLGGGGETGSVILKTFPESDLTGSGAMQPGWSIDAATLDMIANTAKYLVIETEGGAKATGFGGVQMAWNGNATGWKQADVVSGWMDFPRGDGQIVSIVIDLQAAMGAQYDVFLQNTQWNQIIFGNWDGSDFMSAMGFKNLYLTTDFPKPEGAVDLNTGFGFIFGGSVNDLTGIPQIKVPVSQAYGITGGIVVNAANEKVSIYGIGGNLVKQVNGVKSQTIGLAKGLYIVKVGANNAVKVLVK